MHKQYIHVPSCNPKLLKESRFTCMGRKWQRYLNIHFSWEIISRKYATGAWGQGTDHPPQYLDKTTKMGGGGSNSTNTHINQDRLGKTEFQVRMVVEMIRYTVIETS